MAQRRFNPGGSLVYAGMALFSICASVVIYGWLSMAASASAAPPVGAPASTTLAEARDDTPKNQVFRAVEGLKKNNVFTYPAGEVALAEELDDRLKGSSIGVVVLPGSATMESYNDLVSKMDTGNYEGFAAAIYDKVDQDKYRTIIVLSKNKYSSWSNQNARSVEVLLAGASALNPEQILLSADDIEDWNEYSKSEWLPWVTIPAGVMVAIFGVLLFLEYDSSRGRRNRADRRAQKKKVAEAKERNRVKERVARENEQRKNAREEERARVERAALDAIPKSLRSRLVSLESWAANHVAPVDNEFAGEITAMADRFRLLFERLKDRGTEQGREVAMVGYTDMLGKISAALSEKYYLDILANPELWDDPEGRIVQVKNAVAGVSFQLLENIKQVNAARDLDFQASLAMLAGFMDNPRLEDIYGKDTKR